MLNKMLKSRVGPWIECAMTVKNRYARFYAPPCSRVAGGEVRLDARFIPRFSFVPRARMKARGNGEAVGMGPGPLRSSRGDRRGPPFKILISSVVKRLLSKCHKSHCFHHLSDARPTPPKKTARGCIICMKDHR